MTCRGYDPRATKIGKPIKRIADTFVDKNARRQYIRSYVEIARSESRSAGKKEK